MKKAAHEPNEFDVLIVGGGMVGASLAAALAPLPFKVAVVEVVPFGKPGQPSYDDRITALSWGSHRIFESIGLWPLIEPDAVAIRHVHVSERGRFGMTRLNADEMGTEALGYVVPNRIIGRALSEFLPKQKNISLIAPAKLTSIQARIDRVTATLHADGIQDVTTRLLVAADGANSEIRKQLGIPAKAWDYGQSAIICNVTVDRPQPESAFERFTNAGPLALLPMGDDRYVLIRTVDSTQLESVLKMNDADFLDSAAEGFGGRFGRFIKAGKRQAYPLSLVRAEAQLHGRTVIVGNAAHSLHPIAAQGFNLSLRDVAALAATLADLAARSGDPGDVHALADYVQGRRRDQSGTTRFTDFLTRVFTNPLASVGFARNSGLLALELFPLMRHRLIRRNMGSSGRLLQMWRSAKSP